MRDSIRISALLLLVAALAFSTGMSAQRSANDTLAVSAYPVSNRTISAASGAILFDSYKPLGDVSSPLTPSSSEAYYSSSFSPEPADPEPFAAGGVALAAPVIIHHGPGSKFFLLNALHMGMAVFDVAMTQHCIATNKCREGNPLMPSSAAGQLGVNFTLVSFGAYSSYRLKKHGSPLWWVSPMTGAVAHGVGVATGFAHR